MTDSSLGKLETSVSGKLGHLLGAHIVATIVTAGFIAVVTILAFHVVADSPLMNVMAGSLGTAFTTVVNFYMGSSIGSAQKTAQVSQLIAAQPQAAPSP